MIFQNDDQKPLLGKIRNVSLGIHNIRNYLLVPGDIWSFKNIYNVKDQHLKYPH